MDMRYCIRVHANGRICEAFARDYESAVVMAEGIEKLGLPVSVWQGAKLMRASDAVLTY
jgi:hypothetical protein